MAAGLGFKDFVTGEVLTAADVDGYLMQGIWVFASAAARDAAVTSPQEGNACYLKDTNQVLTYSGSAWVAVGGGSSVPANETATVNTAQGTSSSSYTDLATAGPAVTVTTGTKALVIITVEVESGSGTAAYVGYDVSGATTIAATDLQASYSTVGTIRFAFHSVPTLTAGSNTFTTKYRSESGTKNFSRRTIFVINLA